MNHLSLSKKYWKSHLKPGSRVIDATLGHGKDAKFLLETIVPTGFLFAYEIQDEAICSAAKHLLPHKGHYKIFKKSHVDFSDISEPIDLIVYNLGYLPKGDKTITTLTESSLKSIQQGLNRAKALSITCYPGHQEGQKEESAILSFLKTVSPQKYHICYHTWPNRTNAPSLFWILQN